MLLLLFLFFRTIHGGPTTEFRFFSSHHLVQCISSQSPVTILSNAYPASLCACVSVVCVCARACLMFFGNYFASGVTISAVPIVPPFFSLIVYWLFGLHCSCSCSVFSSLWVLLLVLHFCSSHSEQHVIVEEFCS